MLKRFTSIAVNEEFSEISRIPEFQTAMVTLKYYLESDEGRQNQAMAQSFAMLEEQLREYTNGGSWAEFLALPPDLLEEPVTDAARSLLDGHIVLSARLASAGHYPAIDILDSISRLMPVVAPREQQDAARKIRRLLEALANDPPRGSPLHLSGFQCGFRPLLDRCPGISTHF